MKKLYLKENASDRTKARVVNGDYYDISRELTTISVPLGGLVVARMICHLRTGWVGWVPESEIRIEDPYG